MTKDYEKCKYCKYAKVNEEYLNSTEAYPPDELDYLVCDILKVMVLDDSSCKDFKLNKRVYRESNC